MKICVNDTFEREDEPLTDISWSLISGFLKAINEHHQYYVTPSDHISVDESVSKWYGFEGEWIKMGFPDCAAYDRKPGNEFELKSAAFRKSGTMLRLELVMRQTLGRRRSFAEEFSYTTALTFYLVQQ